MEGIACEYSGASGGLLKINYYFSEMNTKNITITKIEKPLTKKLNIKKFLGLVKWDEDPVKYQRKLRDGK